MKEEKNISSSVLEQIQNKEIAPKPKWSFLVKDSLVWIFGLLSLFVGSIGFAVILYMILNNDWDVITDAASKRSIILASLPYFWIVVMVLFVLITEYNIRHTKNGYKYTLSTIALGTISASVVFGSLFYAIGFGKQIDYLFEENIDIYNRFLAPKHRVWTNPENGLLTGMINTITKNKLIIETIEDEEWTVLIDDATYFGLLGKEEIEEGMVIRITGEIVDEMQFDADSIKIQPKGRPFGKKRPPMPMPPAPIPMQ